VNEDYSCPRCLQELKYFAFHCPRCGALVGKIIVEGDMLARWWVDLTGAQVKRRGVKTLKSGPSQYLNVKEISATYPSEKNSPDITITTHDGKNFRQSLVEFFREAVDDSQEWKVR
jgi:hypothetical protein